MKNNDAFVPAGPVGWGISQIRKKPSFFPYYIWEDIKKRGFEDFKQNFYLQAFGLRFLTSRDILKATSRAFYRTARELGW